ncbi:arginyl-tRNA synthetase [Flavobacteriaceae bacterium MAR_2010_188]|nr:arginyl-tRNA synthetase [Flavobacteriaceae bacterium MAR_2010_188]
MDLQELLREATDEIVKENFGVEMESLEFQATRKEFEGDITLVIFPMLRKIRGNPVEIGELIGKNLVEKVEEVVSYNVIKGFLNLEISDSFYLNHFYSEILQDDFGFKKPDGHSRTFMVEYSSPNTNKPLHLGHIRNNLLGYSVAEILKAAGNKVYKTQIINDRGIHICKSMVAWQRYGNGETPSSSGIKGDKLVGNYYIRFDQEYKKEIAELVENGASLENAKENAPIMTDAQEMLRQWETGNPDVINLWEMMNEWVYQGFDMTYNNLGVDFDSYYYESETYLLGKEFVKEGLREGVFFEKEDGSVWCDLTDEGLDEKIVLRSDGTAVYMTQDIGTAIQRKKDYPDIDGIVYTVGNEQDYHFKVLFLILKKLGFDWAKNLYHLSYGMVDLPSGKMKSREGTVVDADDLMEEMSLTAKEISEELGKLDGYTEEEKSDLYQSIGLSALKYYILKVDPKKKILFDPKESIDFQGNTGPFIQYTYARIQSILRKANNNAENHDIQQILDSREKTLLKKMGEFPEVISLSAEQYSPALVANYVYDLVKEFNSFYQNVPILSTTDEYEKNFRVSLCKSVSSIIEKSLKLLGIKVVDRM